MKCFLSFVVIFVMTMMFINTGNADSFSGIDIGVSFAAGGRYDEVRMCVITPTGFKGGPAFEFAAFVLEGRINQYFGIGFYLPVARPILFAAAFHMLQFLPEAVFSFHIPINKIVEGAIDLGLGASLHYGPDYLSVRNPESDRSPSFFAAGPRSSLFGGVIVHIAKHMSLKIGIRPYFEYLFSEQIHGKVIGAELDIQFRYFIPTSKK